MSVGKLATALTVIFVVSIVLLVAEILYVLWHRRRTIRPQPTSGDDQHSNFQLLYFLCLKAQTRVEPSGAPTDGSPPTEDSVIDVFKLLEANGPSRVLCTIKEDDREDVDSTTMEVAATETERVLSLQECLEREEMDPKTVLSSPCDSPMFFTPLGSPARDGMGWEFVSPVVG